MAALERRSALVRSVVQLAGTVRLLEWLQSMVLHLHANDGADANDAYRDPLAHPALTAMSLRELADLPFPHLADMERCRSTSRR